ncbi:MULTISPECIES: 16S rRNA (guanine(527)-N(7))-methyltransferase RsmG [unclassified Paenibacillus]|uniref:16S rRNA (guanine(527)-N(7))-methyltransferase RsmG n=1 Tax=unclassified Paenibacillus TaxID=185978 RepID=UPI001C102F7C|nr:MULTISPECIES: 16S rRNA (guanine(527)-N(7))-methyltransferase RsmG [unclassified Paenibacillus]MBU5441958.1 16S rRNA (guanine(527)-N(7))-methyltransferase RsmG [Paenibacillus sp. MSJ-34]CAH0121873.1 Ribosomal RNA small subunit methyltransferase G [Paenibacillus sp. CECT 9249]
MDQIQLQFQQRLHEQGIDVSNEQLEQFETYYRELVLWNEKMNLTGITEREQVYTKHFFDSVSLSFFIDMNEVKSIADIGSGAGFPSFPLKICFPHLQVTIVDSLNKRIQFLQHIASQLTLHDVECIHGRAEDVARNDAYRDRFDLVTARAVARLSVLNEFCLPFARKGGQFAAMKGSDPTDEIREAKRSFKELKGELKGVYPFTLPVEQSDRHIILITKTEKTPAKYPRKAGMPLKSPIV